MVKDLITIQLKRKFGYFCDTQYIKIIARFMIDNIPGHIQILVISYNNTYPHNIN